MSTICVTTSRQTSIGALIVKMSITIRISSCHLTRDVGSGPQSRSSGPVMNLRSLSSRAKTKLIGGSLEYGLKRYWEKLRKRKLHLNKMLRRNLAKRLMYALVMTTKPKEKWTQK
jgi:hypothetical protein